MWWYICWYMCKCAAVHMCVYWWMLDVFLKWYPPYLLKQGCSACLKLPVPAGLVNQLSSDTLSVFPVGWEYRQWPYLASCYVDFGETNSCYHLNDKCFIHWAIPPLTFTLCFETEFLTEPGLHWLWEPQESSDLCLAIAEDACTTVTGFSCGC